jgi:phage baseplate assembly protein W
MPLPQKNNGLSFLLDATGDVVIEENEDGILDAVLVVDEDEIVQSLQLVLTTRLGEDDLHPTMGLPLRDMIAVGTDEFIRTVVVNALLFDNRVDTAEVISIEDEDEGKRIRSIVSSATLKDGRTLTVQAYYGA